MPWRRVAGKDRMGERSDGETKNQREMGRGGDVQDKYDMFTRYISFTSIRAIARWGRTYLDRLSSALSPFLSGSMDLHRRFRLIRADC
jgi:hypothetical protein